MSDAIQFMLLFASIAAFGLIFRQVIQKPKQRRVMTMKYVREGQKWVGPVDDQEAIFHEFSNEFFDGPSGLGQYPVALVEMSDGRVISFALNLIRFI